ncbi:hypothetical protein, partial [Streptomyces sparsus]
EKAKRAKLLLKGAHGAYGDTSRIERELDRIDRDATDRARGEQAAWQRQYDVARDALAAARVAERCADRTEKPTAKAARVAAEKRLRAVERARP